MSLSDATQSILAKVESGTGLPVTVLPDPKAKAPGRLRMARGAMPTHLATFIPGDAAADYFVAFEAGFILRLYALPETERTVFAETARAHEEMRRMGEQGVLGRLPADQRQHVLEQFRAGVLTQLRSQPIGLRVDEWLYNEYPALRESQAAGVASQQQIAAEALHPNIRALAPELIYEANVAMNAAVALALDRLHGRKKFAVPYESVRRIDTGRALLALADATPATPDHDHALVDAWAERVGLSGWYAWKPLNEASE